MENEIKKIIKKKKGLYGSNFECIAEAWSIALKKDIDGPEVARLMSIMKDCRIERISKKIQNTPSTKQKKLKKLHKALVDSQIDRNVYSWIYENYDEYKRI